MKFDVLYNIEDETFEVSDLNEIDYDKATFICLSSVDDDRWEMGLPSVYTLMVADGLVRLKVNLLGVDNLFTVTKYSIDTDIKTCIEQIVATLDYNLGFWNTNEWFESHLFNALRLVNNPEAPKGLLSKLTFQPDWKIIYTNIADAIEEDNLGFKVDSTYRDKVNNLEDLELDIDALVNEKVLKLMG